jgi:hypothetical protein
MSWSTDIAVPRLNLVRADCSDVFSNGSLARGWQHLHGSIRMELRMARISAMFSEGKSGDRSAAITRRLPYVEDPELLG